ncbi:hypothetical protein GGE07_006305 [Sinorhizobium terangae]|uniref:Uncharacterized protein n=1 Tax=Sinorhizobium terangae TaxID=110322 RepID=A0A6N7LFU1_SINTE|nr:hypothetical protein [Sinorhizobium terangae]MBB4189609.1 hypothetical protein [Sinorhizobium terangae]MQX15755.1 hypothetical protein [Sinorhizobium terangae]
MALDTSLSDQTDSFDGLWNPLARRQGLEFVQARHLRIRLTVAGNTGLLGDLPGCHVQTARRLDTGGRILW